MLNCRNGSGNESGVFEGKKKKFLFVLRCLDLKKKDGCKRTAGGAVMVGMVEEGALVEEAECGMSV